MKKLCWVRFWVAMALGTALSGLVRWWMTRRDDRVATSVSIRIPTLPPTTGTSSTMPIRGELPRCSPRAYRRASWTTWDEKEASKHER